MKKTLFLLVALVASMSLNAQNAKVMKVLDGGTVIDTYDVKPTIKVVFEDAPAFGTGTATRTGTAEPIKVKWIQLWAGGPKFAEYNVGAENNKAEDVGGYYTWGGSENMSSTYYNTGSVSLTGENDTATNLWGENWRMPTSAEFQNLTNENKCIATWTNDYKGDGSNIKGFIFTGMGDYKDNKVFFPAAGYREVSIKELGEHGLYWTALPYNEYTAYYLNFYDGFKNGRGIGTRSYGYSVRAVLVENNE